MCQFNVHAGGAPDTSDPWKCRCQQENLHNHDLGFCAKCRTFRDGTPAEGNNSGSNQLRVSSNSGRSDGTRRKESPTTPPTGPDQNPGNDGPKEREKALADGKKKLGFFKQLKKDWAGKKYTSTNMLMTIFGSLISLALLVAAGFWAKHLTSVPAIGEDEGSSIDWKSPKFICGYVIAAALLLYYCCTTTTVDEYGLPKRTFGFPPSGSSSPSGKYDDGLGLGTICAIGVGVFVLGFLGYYLLHSDDSSGPHPQNFDVENPRRAYS